MSDAFKIYLVGGAVRDNLLRQRGVAVSEGDRDWVVVGATPQMMVERGFLPVGNDFPVFLHPKTHEEYALARTERKTARGYHGFQFYYDPSVTLEEDLMRRDLTVNAIAQDQDGALIDPSHGLGDLENKILRHVSPAFKEDPVRVLRLARFKARFSDFSVASQTRTLLKEMVDSGETDALVSERVFSELNHGLAETTPSAMFRVLSDCGFLARAYPKLVLRESTLARIDLAARENLETEIRWALLSYDFPSEKDALAFLKSLRAPNQLVDLVALVRKNTGLLKAAVSAEDFFTLLDSSDVLRRPRRFDQFVKTVSLEASVDNPRLERFLSAYRSIDVAALIKNVPPQKIRETVAHARLEAMKRIEP